MDRSVFTREFASLLACPYERTPLTHDDRVLRCPNGHAFPIVDDVPVLLRSDVPQTIGLAGNSLREAWADVEGRNTDHWFVDTLGISDEQKNGVRMATCCCGDVDPVVSYLVAATNGMLYKHVVGLLRDYPIPEIRLADGQGKVLLDVGCSWGPWLGSAAECIESVQANDLPCR